VLYINWPPITRETCCSRADCQKQGEVRSGISPTLNGYCLHSTCAVIVAGQDRAKVTMWLHGNQIMSWVKI
jgi:hypothetical protein